MAIKLPFRLPSRIAWRSAGSGLALALLAYWLASPVAGVEATRSFGFGSFVLFVAALYALAFQFSEWRNARYSLLALAVTLGVFFMNGTAGFPAPLAALLVAVLGALMFSAAAPGGTGSRQAARALALSIVFLAAFLLFTDPAPLVFAAFTVSVALLARDEVRAWSVLRVGEGKLIGAALALAAAELAAVAGFLPLGPARSAAFVTFALLIAREGLREAYHGGLRRELVFRGMVVFFALSVAIFAAVPWTI